MATPALLILGDGSVLAVGVLCSTSALHDAEAASCSNERGYDARP